MPAIQECPSAADLRLLLIGQVALPEVDSLEDHVLSCDRCLETAAGLEASDPLIEAMARARERPFPQEVGEEAASLIQRLKALRAGDVLPETLDSGTPGGPGGPPADTPPG